MIHKSHSDYPKSKSGRSEIRVLNFNFNKCVVMACVCVCVGGGGEGGTWINLAHNKVCSRVIVETVIDLNIRRMIFD
jgi:hypothetical protein